MTESRVALNRYLNEKFDSEKGCCMCDPYVKRNTFIYMIIFAANSEGCKKNHWRITHEELSFHDDPELMKMLPHYIVTSEYYVELRKYMDCFCVKCQSDIMEYKYNDIEATLLQTIVYNCPTNIDVVRKIITYLIFSGADLYVVDSFENSLKDLGEMMNRVEIIDLLDENTIDFEDYLRDELFGNDQSHDETLCEEYVDQKSYEEQYKQTSIMDYYSNDGFHPKKIAKITDLEDESEQEPETDFIVVTDPYNGGKDEYSVVLTKKYSVKKTKVYVVINPYVIYPCDGEFMDFSDGRPVFIELPFAHELPNSSTICTLHFFVTDGVAFAVTFNGSNVVFIRFTKNYSAKRTLFDMEKKSQKKVLIDLKDQEKYFTVHRYDDMDPELVSNMFP